MVKILKFIYWFFLKKRNFSQANEEKIISELFKKKPKGFYIDVGCYNPRKYSNTALLYKKGWTGINIDAEKKNLKWFKIFRKRDINLNYFISNKKTKIDYCVFDESALNGIYDNERLEVLKKNGFEPLEIRKMKTYSLDEILSIYKTKNKDIDFLDIDVEGHDFQVLKSINLRKYNVSVILIEINNKKKNITEFLLKNGYVEYMKEDRNVFFTKK